MICFNILQIINTYTIKIVKSSSTILKQPEMAIGVRPQANGGG